MKLLFTAFAFLFLHAVSFAQGRTLSLAQTNFDVDHIANRDETSFFTNTFSYDEAPASGGSGGAAGPLADSVDLYVSLNWLDTFMVSYPMEIALYYQNRGSQAAANVKLLLIKDSRITFFKTSLPYSTTSGDTATWNLGTLAPGKSGTITVQLRLPETTAIINQFIETRAAIYPYAGDKDTTNNKSRLYNRVHGAAQYIRNLSLSLTEENKPQPGGTANYKLLYGYSSWLDSVKGRIAFIKDPALTFVASRPVGAFAKGDTVFFNFNNPGPFFDTASVSLQFRLASQKSFGTQIKNHAFIRPTITDLVIPEARDTLVQIVQLWYNTGDITPITDRQGIQWIKPVSELPVRSDIVNAIDTLKTGALLIAAKGYSEATRNYGLLLQKISRDGTTLFSLFDTLDTNSDVRCVKELSNGNLVVGGTAWHMVADFGNTLNHTWIRMYDSSGMMRWQRDFLIDTSKGAIRQSSHMSDLIVGSEDAVIAVGSTRFTDSTGSTILDNGMYDQSWICRINAQGVVRWMKKFQATENHIHLGAITKAHDGGMIVAGLKKRDGSPHDTSLLYKIDEATGDVIWQKTLSLFYHQGIASIVPVLNGYMVAGEAETAEWTQGGWLAKLDVNGNLLWYKTLSVAQSTMFDKMQRDENGGVVCLGSLYNFFSGNNGRASGIFRFDSSGNLLSAKILNGDSPFTSFYNIVALGSEEYAVAGFVGDSLLNHQYVHPEQRGGAVIKLGNNNTITGTVYLDENNNGKKDASEKYLSGIRVKSESAGFAASNSATVDGVFKNFTGKGTYITTPVLNNPNFSAHPVSDTTLFTEWFDTDTVHFAVVPLANVADLQVHLLPLTPARPGFTTTYQIKYFNAGSATFSNTHIELQKGNLQTYLQSTQANATVLADTIRWNIGTVAPLTGGAFEVQLRNSTPPALNNGDTLFLKASIKPATADATPADNVAALQHIAQGSFDPNDKQELNNGVYTQEQAGKREAFTYLIRFQNTGTDTAFRVIVRDTLDKNLDWTTLEMLSASHAYQLRVKNGNQHEWVFENINLPDSNRNEPGSHGYIAFRIKPKAEWVTGDSIRNRASIYFDFNLPVKTNTVRTLFKMATVTAVPDVNALNATVSVYPNPTPDVLWVKIAGQLRGKLTLTIYDSHGRLMQQQNHGRTSTQTFTTKVNVAQLAKGIYFMHIAIDGKKTVYKIIVH